MHPTAACHDTRDCVRVVTNSAPERSISDDRLRLSLPAPAEQRGAEQAARIECGPPKQESIAPALAGYFLSRHSASCRAGAMYIQRSARTSNEGSCRS
jgi:hypothetical protein